MTNTALQWEIIRMFQLVFVEFRFTSETFQTEIANMGKGIGVGLEMLL